MLDDYSLDCDLAFPISPENSVSDMLGSVHRPSASSIPSNLFTWSSGDIPVVLYDNAYVDERLSNLLISGNSRRESMVTLDSDPSPWYLHHLQRFSTASGTGLFDHRHSSSSHLSSESTVVECYGTGEAILNDPSFSQGTASQSVSNHSSFVGTSRVYDNPDDLKKSPSGKSWFSVGEWHFKDRVALDSTSSLPGALASSETVLTVPLAGGFEEQQCSLEDTRPPSHAPETVQDHPEAVSPFERPSDSVFHGLHSFLKSITVQFLIDQEGFRDAEPSFKFGGISRVRSSGEHESQDRTMAHFRPVSRQQFHFHHAPFETPPILRRITVNNDDTSDYVSRQAHFTLKANGVYVIHGHEVVSAENASEQIKLYWQFEYLVDDRRVESSGSGRDLKGEKTFTPLTFLCSPRLLLPSQAKRINIMHVFKKSLAPKLVAEKVQVRLAAHRSPSNPSTDTKVPLKMPHYRSSGSHDLHSRGARDGAPNRRAVSDHVSIGTYSERQNEYAAGQLNRTPFAEEKDSRSSTSGIGINRPVSKRGSHATADRHIVPPSRLSELLIQDLSSKDTPGRQGVPPTGPTSRSSVVVTRERDSKTLQALSPRPKRPASFQVLDVSGLPHQT